jgi:hypothetical protein
VLQEADKRWGPPEASGGALRGGRGARDVRLEYGPEPAHAARVQLGVLETGYSCEAPPVAVQRPASGWSTLHRGGVCRESIAERWQIR